MARLLHVCDAEEAEEQSGEACYEHRHHHHRLIPIGRIDVDCRPVTFETPGQARNVLSCAVNQVISVPITQTTMVQVPDGTGCFMCIPFTQTVNMPVLTTVNIPPVLTPIPERVCPCGC